METSTSVSKKCKPKEMVNTDFSDLINNCRICMKRTSKMQPLFKEGNIALLAKVIYCTGLQLEEIEGLPSNICNICIENLATSFNFKSTCLRSNALFHNLPLKRVEIRKFYDERNVNKEKNCKEKFVEVKFVEKKVDKGKLVEEIVKKDNFDEIKTDFMVDDDDNANESLCNDDQQTNEEPQEILETDTKKDYDENSSDYISEVEIVPESPKVCSNVEKKYELKRPIQNGVKVYVCKECGLTFESTRKKWAHRYSEHILPRCNDTFMCESCGLIFNDKYKFGSHKQSHRPPTMECPKCDYKTASRGNLNKHIARHSDVKQYQCHYCALCVCSSSDLNRHIKRVHQPMRKYKCEQCNKWFYEKYKLKRHMDSHNNVKRFHCEHCNSHFTRRNHLRIHSDKQHGITVPKLKSGKLSMHAKMEKIINNDYV